MKNTEQEKGQIFIVLELVSYMAGSVVIKTILKKATGNVSAMSFDTGESLSEKTSPYDTLIQVIDGKAHIVINDQSHQLVNGQAIILPAHARTSMHANARFKMLSTVIKSGYEEIVL